jgi:hypothetical protein
MTTAEIVSVVIIGVQAVVNSMLLLRYRPDPDRYRRDLLIEMEEERAAACRRESERMGRHGSSHRL